MHPITVDSSKCPEACCCDTVINSQDPSAILACKHMCNCNRTLYMLTHMLGTTEKNGGLKKKDLSNCVPITVKVLSYLLLLL